MISGPSVSTALFLQDTQQRHAFEFYQLRSSLELSGPFLDETEIWNRLVLQVAHHETAIRYAVCALASFHQEFSGDNYNGPGTFKTGLEQYTLALKALVTTNASRKSIEVTLIACLLFTLCEHLQGRLSSAKAHVDSGLKLLKTYLSLLKETNPNLTKGLDDYQSYFPSTTLCQLFKRLHRQLTELGQDPTQGDYSFHHTTCLSLPSQFLSMGVASDILENLVDQIIRVIERATARRLTACSAEMAVLRETCYARLSQQLDQWKITFDQLLCLEHTRNQNLEEEQNEATMLLHLWYFASRVFLKIDSPNEVMDYDRCTPIFQEMVEIGYSLLNKRHKHQTETNSSTAQKRKEALDLPADILRMPRSKDGALSHDILQKERVPAIKPSYFSCKAHSHRPVFTHTAFSPLPPLFLIVTRCREPTLRRQALRILAQLNRRDGFWDSNIVSICAGSVLDSEELAALNLECQGESTSQSMRVKSAIQVPARARIMGIKPEFRKSELITIEFLKA
jgi:hypothetical protein